jgi:hypothetical protein
MSAVEKWMDGKSPIIAAIALGIALSAPDVSEALTEMREEADTFISQPPLCVWLDFYKNHRKVLDVVQNLFSSEGIEKLVSESVSGMKADFSPQEHNQLIQLYSQPVTLFLLKVWGPCTIYYKTTPTHLFRQARLGKVSAFEKLLRLDNSVIFDKKLSEIFHQHKGKKNKQNYRKLLLAFHKPIPGKTDPKYIKSFAAGLISIATESMGKRLTEPQIRKLFDAIAKDHGHGLQDEDIPPTPDSFAQAIRREAKKMKVKKTKPDKR